MANPYIKKWKNITQPARAVANEYGISEEEIRELLGVKASHRVGTRDVRRAVEKRDGISQVEQFKRENKNIPTSVREEAGLSEDQTAEILSEAEQNVETAAEESESLDLSDTAEPVALADVNGDLTQRLAKVRDSRKQMLADEAESLARDLQKLAKAARNGGDLSVPDGFRDRKHRIDQLAGTVQALTILLEQEQVLEEHVFVGT